ncbi:glycoside hydrolase domain-containing protein [Lacrimispora sp.]|uniref:glycoside hydrolase domain-containing protein n=1 Tax=Lacrimispora sp. TaxID=2719234 RepID=UPI0028AF4434|nr:glycoside hydrolase domain-containing protein [Lacrimispora sp.]
MDQKNDHIEPFLEHRVPHIWSYYCTARCVDAANRFMAMLSARKRVYGLQVYKYGIEGILH